MSPLPPLSPNASLRYDVIRRLLPDGPATVLEVGCGMGGVGARLAQRYDYLGLEPDPTSYAVAARRVGAASPSGEVRNTDLAGLADDERFDLVCAFEVLEHIEDDRAALKEWVSRLKPGGQLLLSTPAHQARFASADTMAGHFRRYDPEVMAERLTEAGLVDQRIVLYGMPLGYLLEAGRNVVGRRRLREPGADMAERTSGSGRLLQPGGRLAGTAIGLTTKPFQLVQRAFPNRGPGLVASARKPGSVV
ncbi:MAG: class I SAM-dependent methyltransferase [Sporichthyaceae bacterium]|nr:class I SAM-dependent methyltransferase [Sporichthyaceae bacterium]